MTTVLDDTEVHPTPPVGPARRPHEGLAALPWLIPAALLVAGLLTTGTPARDVALYAAYLAFAVVLPGMLVHRALRGSRGNLPEDLGLGLATGLVVLLVGWALTAATGLQALLPGWPVLIVVLFLTVPRLRRHWRIAQPRPLPLLWSWIVAGALVGLILAAYAGWKTTPLPPATAAYYPDLFYHLALVHEMTRSMPFQVPQLAGDTLRYHYLSDADMAVSSMITGIAPATVLLRLWLVPVAAATLFVSAALARQVTGKWWAGAMGGAAAVAVLPLSLGAVTGVTGVSPINLVSPSETYSLPLVALLLTLVVDVLRGHPLRWAWVMVFPLALACAGAKSSALPPVLAGLLLAGLIVVFRHRDRLRSTVVLIGAVVAAMAVGLKIFAGGGAGTTALQPLSILYWFSPYRQTIGSRDVIDGSLALPAGVANASATGVLFIALLVAWWAVMQAPRLLGVAVLGAGRSRWDPAAWLLAGVVTSGVCATFLLWHPSASQVYFFAGTVPFGSVLTLWLLADRTRGPRAVLAGLAAGFLTSAVWYVMPKPKWPARTLEAWTWALLRPLLLTVVVAVVLGGLALVAWRAATGRTAWRALPVALIAAVLGAGLFGYAVRTAKDTYVAVFRTPSTPRPARAVTRDEMVAALWLDQHAGRNDIVATNVHCLVLDAPVCDSRAFWVGGLGGRRTLIESWGYTDQAVANDGVNGRRYVEQEPPYPDRYALNQRVFARGDAADVAELRTRYHVRWLFADSRMPGGAAPGLAQVATPRYTSGPVTVYELAAAP